ncbi:MAG: hypothetical protein JO205_01230 [Pseudolabrys sp.]|nr:hypothetical protein [Pseudolabrys sp.]MBV9259970.1 hypothetical protein [Pseudolabrys sp.]
MANFLKFQVAALIVLGAAAMIVPAHAFTFNNADGNSGGKAELQADGLPVYTDPRHKLEDSDNKGGSSFKFGGGTMTVGPQRSFDNDFYSSRDRMLSPIGRDR